MEKIEFSIFVNSEKFVFCLRCKMKTEKKFDQNQTSLTDDENISSMHPLRQFRIIFY